jgi:PAS domain S-box-containing protein
MIGHLLNRTHLHAVITMLILAAVYAITGRLALYLAIPPGYATAIWPPAGLALAGILMHGTRVWPGIWLGSVLVNFWTALHPAMPGTLLTAIAIPTSIGVGAAMQALVGAVLVRRGVGFPTPLDRGRAIVVFLLLGGPISCLVGASVGATALLVSGQIPWAMFAITWGTWWAGDTLGVLIVTPLLLSWLGEPRSLGRRRQLAVALPLVGALILAGAVFVYTSAQERARLTLLFERQATALASTLQNRLDDYLDVLYAAESVYASSGGLSRQVFDAFVQRAVARHLGLQALSWDVRVPDGQREAYESAIRREGYPAFQITEQDLDGTLVPAAQRPEYIVVTYIEPPAGNGPALGFDVASAPDRIEALRRARETAQPSATGRLTLVQDTDQHVGVLVFLPIYAPGQPRAMAEERRQHLHSYVTGVFRIDNMVQASLPGLEGEGLALGIVDETAPAHQRVLYDSREQGLEGTGPALGGGAGEALAGIHWDTTVTLADRRWALRFAPTLAYLAARQSVQPWVVLGGGLLFASLLGTFLVIVTGRATIIEQLMAERTAQLAASQRAEERFRVAVEAAPSAMLMVDQSGTIVLVNAQAEAVFGYARADLLGLPIERLVPARYRGQHPEHRTAFFAAPRARPMGAGRDLYGLHKDGHEIPVEIGLTPVTLEKASYVLASVVDLTARQQAEAVRAQLAAIVESSDDAIIGKTLTGCIVSWNAGAERMYGYTHAEAEGRPLAILAPPNRPDEVPAILDRLRQGERLEHYETVHRRKDGTLVDVSLTISLIRNPAGALVGASVIARDITPRKKAEKAIRALNESLEQRVTERTAQLEAANLELASEIAERMRAEEAIHTLNGALEQRIIELKAANDELTAFSYSIAHDLRAPLRAMNSYAHILLEDHAPQLETDAQHYLQRLGTNARRMGELIDHLLEFSRLNRQPLNRQPVAVMELVHEVWEDLGQEYTHRHVEMSMGALPPCRADPMLLRQVWVNLLGNALKFTRRRTVARIWVDCQDISGECVYVVRDNGIGFDMQYADKLFGVFQRLHQNMDYEGTGVGLALTQRIVQRHGGRIWAEAAVDQGATFSFTLGA